MQQSIKGSSYSDKEIDNEKLSEDFQHSFINPRDDTNVLKAKDEDYRKSPLKEEPKNKKKYLVTKPNEVDKDKVSTCMIYDLTVDFEQMKIENNKLITPNEVERQDIKRNKKVESHFMKKPFNFSEISNDCRSQQKLSKSNLQALKEIRNKLNKSTYKAHFVNLNPLKPVKDEKIFIQERCPMEYKEKNKEVTKECLSEDLPEKADVDIQGLVPCYPISSKKKISNSRGFLKEQDFYYEEDYRKHKLAINRPVALKAIKEKVVYKKRRILPEGYLVHAIDLGKLQMRHEYEEPPQDMGLTKWKLTEKQKLRPWTRRINFDPKIVEEFDRPHFTSVTPSKVNVFSDDDDDDEIKRNRKVRIATPSEIDIKTD